MIGKNLQDREVDCVGVATRSCGHRRGSRDSQQVAKYLRSSLETNPVLGLRVTCRGGPSDCRVLSTSGAAQTMYDLF